MRFTVNTDILKRHDLSLGEFLVMLIGYYDVNYEENFLRLAGAKIIEPNLFSPMSVILSDNTKNLVAEIITESDERLQRCSIGNFSDLTDKLRDIYPSGLKPGTTYSWRGDKKEIAQKLRLLIVKYDFDYTEEEAVNATKEYVAAFNDKKYMHTLRNFILYTKKDSTGHMEIDSPFMSIIENNRSNEKDSSN